MSAKLKEIQNYKNKKLIEFSNSKVIAKKADHTLSSLLVAKSPLIQNWLVKRSLQEASEEEIVRSWRFYYAENFILGRYPNKDFAVNKKVESLVDSIYGQFLLIVDKKNIEYLFSEAKKAALKKVKSYNLKQSDEAQITKRITNINLYWMERFKGSKFESKPLEALSWGVAYSPLENEINIGLEVLQYKNSETLFAVFAHEIGHSFDSCRWGAFFKGENPFHKVGECLRQSESVGAQKRDDSKMNLYMKKRQLSASLRTSLKMNPTCNKLQYPPIGVQADQLPESFADWFSAEVIAETSYVNQHMRSDLCRLKKLNPGSSYPTYLDRLEKIYLAHPKIRMKLNIKNNVMYCRFN